MAPPSTVISPAVARAVQSGASGSSMVKTTTAESGAISATLAATRRARGPISSSDNKAEGNSANGKTAAG